MTCLLAIDDDRILWPIARHIGLRDMLIAVRSETDADRVLSGITFDAAIVEHRLGGSPCRRVLRRLGTLRVPTVILSEDGRAETWGVPCVDRTSPPDVVAAALEHARRRGTAPRVLFSLQRRRGPHGLSGARL